MTWKLPLREGVPMLSDFLKIGIRRKRNGKKSEKPHLSHSPHTGNVLGH
jgi:hypothetical protein